MILQMIGERKIIWRPSPNFGGQITGPFGVVMHYTASSARSAINWFCDPASQVSAHFVIAKDGAIIQCVDTDRVAWHAGASQWKNYNGCNQFMLGIECENLGLDKDNNWDEWPDIQIGAIVDLCKILAEKYGLTRNDFPGHIDIAVPYGRKIDPGPKFPREKIFSKVFPSPASAGD